MHVVSERWMRGIAATACHCEVARAFVVREYREGMFARLMRSLGRFLFWVGDVVKQVGGALNGGRSADKYASKLYEQRRDGYRP